MNDTAERKPEQGRGLLARWHDTPLYLRIIGALVLGLVVGVLLGERAAMFAVPSQLILRLLGALAPPLILLAVIQALMKAEIGGRTAGRLAGLLLVNTVVAIIVGLLVANVVRPGQWTKLEPPAPHAEAAASGPKNPVTEFLDNVPRSVLGPLTDNGKVIGVIFIAVAFGVAFRKLREKPLGSLEDLVDVLFSSLLVILHWIIDVVPIGVFGIVASIVGREGFQPFAALGAFVAAVLIALALQATYYLLRIRFGSWCRPLEILRCMRDALLMAFSTGSSTATMPVTFDCLRNRVGLRERSASLGSLVGANFNNDGTALYEAMSALFISQMLGIELSIPQQLMVVLTSVVASVGAAGIPEAGLVTMTLVFNAVGLPTQYIALLLTVDWFLDRCRTAINVMGDVTVSCLLDGRERDGGTTSSDHRMPAAPSPVAPVSSSPR